MTFKTSYKVEISIRFIVFIAFLGVVTRALMEYKDCTEYIKRTVANENEGILQFQYVHYPGFWLSQDEDKDENSLKPIRFPNVKAKKVDEGVTFVTIANVETYPMLDDTPNRTVWSWKIQGMQL